MLVTHREAFCKPIRILKGEGDLAYIYFKSFMRKRFHAIFL